MKENKILSRATLISSSGEFIILFSLILVMSVSSSITIAAYSISLKSLGCCLGAAIFPRITRNLGLRSCLRSALLGQIAIAFLLILIHFFSLSNLYFLIVMTLQSFFSQIFSSSRESYSKTLGENNQQRPLQAQILQSFFGAQIIGPLVGFVLANFGFINVALLINLFLQVYSLYLLRSLEKNETYEPEFGFLSQC